MRLLAALAAIPIWAQTGSLTGLVRDPSGVPVSGADIAIRSRDTAAERRLQTNDQGRYLATGLPAGIYSVAVSREGFRSEAIDAVDLGTGRVRDVDFDLVLGTVSESITLTESPRLVDTSSAVWGGSIAKAQLQSLPLNGRDLFELATQQPGASVSFNTVRSMNAGLGARISVNGMRSNQNGFQLDGIRVNEASGGAPSSAAGVLLGLEGIGELRIVTNAFSAEFGRAAGGVVTAVSRSGSNQFHGSLFEFLRNNALDARNFFDSPGSAQPPFRRNQFGGVLSGPIRRNRLFFVSNYEGFREALTQTSRAVTLGAAARNGVLPGRTVPVAASVRPFLPIYPLPNGRDFGDGSGEFIAQLPTRTSENYFAQKADFYASERLRLFGRYTGDSGQRTTPDPFLAWNFASESQYRFAHTGAQFVASPRTIHDLRLGFSRVVNYEHLYTLNPAVESLSFLPGASLGAIEVTGLTELGGLPQRQQPRRYTTNGYQLNYSWAHTAGKHDWRAGAGYDRVQLNQISDNVRAGYQRFSSIANLLQGTPRLFDAMAPGADSVRGWRQNLFFAFLQDEFRPLSRLSISMGLRYEIYSTPTEVNNKIATLRDPLHDTGVTLGGPLFENPSHKNFAPRASLAWDVFGNGRTVVRAGGGIFYDMLSTRELVIAGTRMPPFFRRLQVTNPAFPGGFSNLAGAALTETIDTLDYRPSQPYVGQFQLFVERQFGRATALRAGYVGSRGIHLVGQMSNFNIAVPRILPDGRTFFPADAPFRNPALGAVGIRLTNFDSVYHGLQIGLDSAWRNRFRGQLKYTFSKSLDDSSRAIFQEFQSPDRTPTPLNYRLNRGPSDFDLPHVFAANGSAMLPLGVELHGLVQFQAGPPFNPSVGFDRARLRSGSSDLGQRPDFIPGINVIKGDPAQWFDPLAFGLPELGFYGNLGRNTLRGPGLAMVNVAAHKILWRRESAQLRLRAEFFNLPNRPNFQVPSDQTLFDGTGRRVGSAGRISETATGPRQVQLALRLDF
ncbi:MAG: carboxypeptidase regulatory-like domain-containing protein [Bryobacteraceae bacterium]